MFNLSPAPFDGGVVNNLVQAPSFRVGTGSNYGTLASAGAAHIIEQRDGTNPQSFRLYGTYSSSGTNYERLAIIANAGSFYQIDVSKAGTGVQRGLVLGVAGNAYIGIGTTTAVWNVVTATGNIIPAVRNQYEFGDATHEIFRFYYSNGIYNGSTKILGAQGAAVADATDAPSAITQLNLLLARVRAHGLIAP